MRGRPFMVPVAALRKVPGSVAHERREGPIGGLEVTGSAVPAGATVSVEADLTAAQDTIVVTATVRAPWAGDCRRCLAQATGQIEASTREVYEPDTDEEETYRLQGDRIDLEPLARDAVLLGLPPAPLCHEGCRGLCPTCGANLNEGPCGCDEQLSDPRWAALDALRGERPLPPHLV
jgi:uncharacterized protein